MNHSELDELLNLYPCLFHMAERDAWRSGIKEHGLLSTSSLLDLYGRHGKERFSIESKHRKEIITMDAPGLNAVKIRDQKPMDDSGLLRCLPHDISPQQWYEFLNQKVFFWMTRDRLHKLSNARAYRSTEHEVLILNSRKIVEAYSKKIWLCPYNSGCTKPFPHPRSYSIFSRIEDYPYQEWRCKRGRSGDIVVELCIDGGVSNIVDFVEHGYVIRGTEKISDII